MKFIDKTSVQFIEELSSNAPTPGGGGASALVGALGVALGMMVGNLALGNPAYARVEGEIKQLLERAQSLRDELMKLVDEDAVVFKPLAKAYSIPKDDPSRAQAMEDALKLACTVPMEIMRLSARTIEICDEFAKKGARGALSDAGIGAVFGKAALLGASLNVFINTKYMDNKAYAKKLNSEANELLLTYCQMADEIYDDVASKLR